LKTSAPCLTGKQPVSLNLFPPKLLDAGEFGFPGALNPSQIVALSERLCSPRTDQDQVALQCDCRACERASATQAGVLGGARLSMCQSCQPARIMTSDSSAHTFHLGSIQARKGWTTQIDRGECPGLPATSHVGRQEARRVDRVWSYSCWSSGSKNTAVSVC
jgi:hypothetical protein